MVTFGFHFSINVEGSCFHSVLKGETEKNMKNVN